MKRELKNSVRIIGGKWRSRKITFADSDDLRPTPDRVRETLFNWLQNEVQDARCLDLFAGSGALGFEALSRGAASVVMLDNAPAAITHLHNNAAKLNTDKASIIQTSIPAAKLNIAAPFDIVFIDPPYQQDLIAPCCEWLQRTNLLAPKATLYLEVEPALNPLPIPAEWDIFRQGSAGQVNYYLIHTP